MHSFPESASLFTLLICVCDKNDNEQLSEY